MYSTCLYCSRDLGTNEVVETLPIGRRIAFDEGTGRLWVVCRSCEKWNLVPFDNRLETIDACERLFRDAKLKFSTDNIGIARLPEGLDLVRIGRAERHEFAAWRYGDQFGRRRTRRFAMMGGVAVAGVGVLLLRHAFAPWMTLPIGGGAYMPQIFRGAREAYLGRRIATTVDDPSGGRLMVTGKQLRTAQFRIDEAGSMSLAVEGYERAVGGFATEWSAQHIRLAGADVIPTLGQLLPPLNAAGAKRDTVRDAVDLLSDKRTPGEIVNSPWSGRETLGRMVSSRVSASSSKQRKEREALEVSARHGVNYRLANLPETGRLALEMLAHEDTERLALAGQLKLLERQWKEADKLAKIADDMVLRPEP